jgi:hypothetical protein
MSALWLHTFGISRCTTAMNPELAGMPPQRPVFLCLSRPRRFPSSRKVRESMIASTREGLSVIGESLTMKITVGSSCRSRSKPPLEVAPSKLSLPAQSRRTSLRQRWLWCVLLTFHLLLLPWPTYAYIDPGTGSIMVQALIAGLLGVIFFFKIFWAKIKARIKGWRPFGGEDPTQDGRSD